MQLYKKAISVVFTILFGVTLFAVDIGDKV